MSYLKKIEWSMGNGQCPECCGVPPKWHGHPLHLTAEKIGHKPDCALAAELKAHGGKPIMIGDYKSDLEYESYITESGFYSTRLKTEHGCPVLRADQEKWDEYLFKILAGVPV